MNTGTEAWAKKAFEKEMERIDMKKMRKKKESSAARAEGIMNRALDRAIKLHHPTTVRWVRRMAAYAKGVKLSDEILIR